jgi:hypothetical protein
MTRPRALLILAIALIALAAGLAFVEYGRLSRGLYEQAALAEGRAVRDRLSMHLSPPLSALNLTARLVTQSGRDDAGGASTLVLSALAEEPNISAATLVKDGSVQAMAVRESTGFLLFTGQAGSGGQWTRYAPDMTLKGPATLAPDATAEIGRALEAARKEHSGDGPVWTHAHALPVGNAAAITVAAPAGPVTNPNGGPPRFLAFSFGLDEAWRVATLGADPDARVLILSTDGLALDPDAGTSGSATAATGEGAPSSSAGGTPGGGALATNAGWATNGGAPSANPGGTPRFVPAASARDPVLALAAGAWAKAGRVGGEAFSFQARGETWWASLFPFTGETGRTYVGVALSQRTLSAHFFEGGRGWALAGLGLAIAVGLLAWLAVRARRKRQRGDGGFYESGREIRALLDAGESERLEFKSTLRFNLASGKPGKEIELAAMKTITAFMNTDGGVLAVGVDDKGQALGLDADGFADDDHFLRHFASLFAQHVGVEFLPFAEFAIRPLEGHKVFLAECRKSAAPVILKTGKEEEFYVRAGPSSRRLSLSEFMRRVAGKGGEN